MKIVVTGGCSFSETTTAKWSRNKEDFTWPLFLKDSLSAKEFYNDGIGAQGNDLIARQIIWRLSKLLKHHNADDILVGIMWTTSARHSVLVNFDDGHEFTYGQPVVSNDNTLYKKHKFYNPYTWDQVDYSHCVGWALLHSQDSLGKIWYKNFYSDEHATTLSLEHVLRVQWFLKLHKIKYFMTTYMGVLFDPPELHTLKHLWEQIDFEHVLPVVGEYEWVKSQGLSFRDEQGHPSAESHEAFVNQVIIPFLKDKKYIQ